MCGEVVAAPLSLQDTVYPILRKKSLHFCEKSKKFLKLCTAVRKKYKTKRLRRRTNSLRQNLSVLPAPSEREPLAWRESLRLKYKVAGTLAPPGGANPLSLLPMVAASSPEGGALFVLTGRCQKAPPSGELARRKP